MWDDGERSFGAFEPKAYDAIQLQILGNQQLFSTALHEATTNTSNTPRCEEDIRSFRITNHNGFSCYIDQGNSAGYAVTPELKKIVIDSWRNSNPQTYIDHEVEQINKVAAMHLSKVGKFSTDSRLTFARQFSEAIEQIAKELSISWVATADNVCWLGHDLLFEDDLSIDALHIGFEDANKKSPPFLPKVDKRKPRPSSIFFLTLSSAFTGFFLASEYL